MRALTRNGGQHVVYLGSGGVRDLTMAAQAELVSRSPRWTVIRPSTFAVNALWWAKQIRAGDEVRGAHGDLAMAMLHEADIADRPARTFAEWVADHAAEFGKMSA